MTFAPDLSTDAIADLARALFGPENKRLSNARELRFGRAGSLSVVPSRGVFTNFETGEAGGILDLVVHGGGARDRRGAAEFLEIGAQAAPRRENPRLVRRREAEAEKDRRARRAIAGALWAAGTPLACTVAETYLRRARGVSAPLAEASLRFIQAAPLTPYRPDHRRAPALVAAVVTSQGELIGAHLTFLKRDGSGKAKLLAPRKMVGTVRGGHVPLIAGTVLVVAEGIESALSAWEAVRAAGRNTGALAALSAGGLAALEFPRDVTNLIIAPDRDPSGAGMEAAKELARRAHKAGIGVALLAPPDGFSDWNDAAMGREQ